MREIKFRAWCQTYDGYEMIYDFCYLDKKENHFFATDLTNDRPDVVEVLAVMQYTGLNDKNWEEIYKGDIARCANGMIGEVIYNENAEYRLKIFSQQRYIYYSFKSLMFIVIGNIYENPELLEKL